MNITKLSTGSSNVLLVSLPEKVYWPTRDGDELCWLINTPYDDNVRDSIKLPPGNWIGVGWSDSLTEEQTDSLIKKVKHLDIDMFPDFTNSNRFYSSSSPSWQSFLSANNIKEKKFVLRDNK